MAKYRLVNNTEYDLKGVYYVGPSEKYWDMFNIGPRDTAKIYTDLQEAIKDKEMLKRRFKYECFEVETVQ
jgi:hypothetical protein